MADYKISNEAKADLIRIHQYGEEMFGMKQADQYFNSFFNYCELISKSPYSFESIEHVRIGYRRCACGSDTIYFRINNDIIEIMAIVGKQDLKNKL